MVEKFALTRVNLHLLALETDQKIIGVWTIANTNAMARAEDALKAPTIVVSEHAS